MNARFVTFHLIWVNSMNMSNFVVNFILVLYLFIIAHYWVHKCKKGSRTELCLKCNRYIQFKDQEAHDLSNCTFPVIKSSSNPTSSHMTNERQNIRPDWMFNYNNFQSTSTRFDRERSMTLLPCEFCHENFYSDELFQHQVEFVV